jgi:hypothetical protein
MAVDPTSVPPAYEFTTEQEKLIGDLGRSMRVVGLVVLAYSLTGIILMVVAAWRAKILAIDLNPILGLFVGAWALSAGRSFLDIATTQGQDIRHLMTALGKLRSLFRLIAILMVIALVLAAVVLLTIAFLHPAGSSVQVFGHPIA